MNNLESHLIDICRACETNIFFQMESLLQELPDIDKEEPKYGTIYFLCLAWLEKNLARNHAEEVKRAIKQLKCYKAERILEKKYKDKNYSIVYHCDFITGQKDETYKGVIQVELYKGKKIKKRFYSWSSLIEELLTKQTA